MSSISTIIIIVQVLSALAIIGLVLVQQGKGADMGAAFGSGASGSLFGATGSSNFLSRSTAIAAVIFFSATLALTLVGNRRAPESGSGVMENVSAPAAEKVVAPAAKKVEETLPPPVPGQAGQIPK